MSLLLPYVVAGVATGSVYSLAALGLVLTYKTSGFFNFAHGSIAAVGATVFYEVRQQAGVPLPLALLITLLIVGVGGGLALEVFARSLAVAPTSIKVLSAVGLLLLAQGSVVIIIGTNPVSFKPFLPAGSLALIGVQLSYARLIEIIVCLIALAALIVFFRVSRLGVAMQAVVESSDLLGLDGVNPVRVRRSAWIIGASFATVSGLFLANSFGLDSTLFFLLVVQAFGAAAIGAFSSLALTYVGGIGIGVGVALATGYLVQRVPLLSGLPPSMSFVVLVVVLVAFPSRLPNIVSSAVRGGTSRLAGGVRSPGPRNFYGLIAIAVIGATVPLYAGLKILTVTQGLLTTIQLLSLALLVRLSGQVSLCQVSFAAVGAVTFGHLINAGTPWLLAVLLAGLMAIPVGALVAIPAIRLSGIYLAIATFGFGILLQELFYGSSLMFGKLGSFVTPRPHFAGLDSDKGYFYVVLFFALSISLLLLVIAKSRLGRLLRALSDSPVALTTGGTKVNTTKVLVFCISAFIAAISGALSGPLVGRTSTTDFFPESSLILVVVLLINGRGLILPSIRAAFALALPAYIAFFGSHQTYLAPLFGLIAIVVGAAASRPARERAESDSDAAEIEPRTRRRAGHSSGAWRHTPELVASR